MKRMTIDERIQDLRGKGIYIPVTKRLPSGEVNVTTCAKILNMSPAKIRQLIRLNKLPFADYIPAYRGAEKEGKIPRDRFVIYKDKLQKYLDEEMGIETDLSVKPVPEEVVRKEQAKAFTYKKNTVRKLLTELYEEEKKAGRIPAEFRFVCNAKNTDELIEEVIVLMEAGCQMGMTYLDIKVEDDKEEVV